MPTAASLNCPTPNAPVVLFTTFVCVSRALPQIHSGYAGTLSRQYPPLSIFPFPATRMSPVDFSTRTINHVQPAAVCRRLFLTMLAGCVLFSTRRILSWRVRISRNHMTTYVRLRRRRHQLGSLVQIHHGRGICHSFLSSRRRTQASQSHRKHRCHRWRKVTWTAIWRRPMTCSAHCKKWMAVRVKRYTAPGPFT